MDSALSQLINGLALTTSAVVSSVFWDVAGRLCGQILEMFTWKCGVKALGTRLIKFWLNVPGLAVTSQYPQQGPRSNVRVFKARDMRLGDSRWVSILSEA